MQSQLGANLIQPHVSTERQTTLRPAPVLRSCDAAVGQSADRTVPWAMPAAQIKSGPDCFGGIRKIRGNIPLLRKWNQPQAVLWSFCVFFYGRIKPSTLHPTSTSSRACVWTCEHTKTYSETDSELAVVSATISHATRSCLTGRTARQRKIRLCG